MHARLPITGLVLTSLFLILFVLERYVPLRTARHPLTRRLLVNLCISALAIGAAAALVNPTGAATLQQISERRFGLIYLVELPAPVQLVIGFVLMDLMFYYWHRANHKIPFLWRFHSDLPDRRFTFDFRNLRTVLSGEHAISSQQRAPAGPGRAIAEQDTGDPAIVIGIPGYAAAADGRLGSALLLPFGRQRSYWQSVDGINVERNPTDGQSLTGGILESLGRCGIVMHPPCPSRT